MTTAATPIQAPQREHVLLHDVSWATYDRLTDEVDRGKRMTYDRGMLEIVSPLYEPDSAKTLLGRFIETLTLELGIAVNGAGSTTFKKEDIERGFEPDECFYIQNSPALRGVKRIDLTIHPPPDLMLEVDLTHRSIPRQPIYAAFGVPEIWRYEHGKLQALQLKEGQYTAIETSLALPMLRPADLEPYLAMWPDHDQTTILRRFRDWVRTDLNEARPL